MTDWAAIPVWHFCRLDTKAEAAKYAVKVTNSVEPPYVGTKERDGPLTIRTLINSAQKLVGYSFTFFDHPIVREFDFSLAAAYGVPDSDEMLLVLGSPHLRVIRSGTERRVFHVVLRHK